MGKIILFFKSIQHVMITLHFEVGKDYWRKWLNKYWLFNFEFVKLEWVNLWN